MALTIIGRPGIGCLGILGSNWNCSGKTLNGQSLWDTYFTVSIHFLKGLDDVSRKVLNGVKFRIFVKVKVVFWLLACIFRYQ